MKHGSLDTQERNGLTKFWQQKLPEAARFKAAFITFFQLSKYILLIMRKNP